MRPSSLITILCLGLAACGGDDLILPKDGEPARITVVSSANPRQVVGRVLAESLVVEVTDPGGRPVSNVEVLFVPPEGGGVEPSSRVTTGSDGRAAVVYTLGPKAGEQAVEARAPIEPPTNAIATIRVLADPDVPVGLKEDDGNNQNAFVSTVLPESLRVKAVDRFENGVPGVVVTWEATGGGEVSPTTVTTGADGLAATAMLLGDRPGAYGAVAQADALGSVSISFTATATAAPRPELVLTVQPSAEAAAGVPLEQQPQIQLQDPFGAPLPVEGVSVTVQVAQGEGSVGGRTTARSDAAGRVTFSDLELWGETGTMTLIFAAEGFTPVSSSEITLRAGPPAAEESSISVEDGTAGTATPISMRIRDEFGNNVLDAGEALSVSIQGANPTPAVSVEHQGNGLYAFSYVPMHSGVDDVIVDYRGQPLLRDQSVVAAASADPTTTTATLSRDFFAVDVVVTTRDPFGNALGRGGDQVLVRGSVGDPLPAEDAGDGTYRATVLVFFGGTVSITLNGVPIAGSPFTP